MTKKSSWGLIALMLMVPFAHAGKPMVFATDAGAINGYDPVAYFAQEKPVKGNDQYSLEWQGASYRFASAKNLEMFKGNPDKYAPQYGGYCAFAVSKGATAPTVPEAWTIVDGKLYLNYSLDVRERWRQDVPGNIKSANDNWPGVLN